MKKDRRVLYTKNMIRNTFINLLQIKPLNKISVTEICKIAEISRSTFYQHYADCYEILEEMQSELCNQLIEILKPNESNAAIDYILNINNTLRENSELYLLLIRSNYPMHSFNKFIKHGKQFFIEQKLANTNLTPKEQEWLADYIIAADFAYAQRTAALEYNSQREQLIYEFIKAGIDHFRNHES